jgi:DNA-binding response OmpR family regulator
MDVRMILVVESDPQLRSTICAGLAAGGFQVHQAASLGEANDQAVRGGRYEALVLSAQLPDGSGFDYCANLRRRGMTAPVIMVLPDHAHHAALQAVRARASDHVRRSGIARELLDRVRGQMLLGELHPAGAARFGADDLLREPA